MYKRKDETDFHEVVLDTDSESYTLLKLEEWMEYEVKMSAFNDVGSSPYSPVSTERTRDASRFTSEFYLEERSIFLEQELSC